MNKADAKASFAGLADSLSQIALIRREAREAGLRLPDDVRKMIVSSRKQLLNAGLPQHVIDATPGMEPPDY